jgi:hypothetical protein
MREFLEASGVKDELLRVHGVAPGSKAEGVIRLIYENLNGLNARMNDNAKLDKARELINDLEADIVCYNEHRLNLMHKSNKSGFSQLFRGGESEIRTIAAHNSHEGKEVGRTQEGGTAMLAFGTIIEQLDTEHSGRDESGLGRWVAMTFQGEGDIRTRVVCGYNPCYNKNQTSRTSYQQHRRYFVNKEKDDTCPRTRFRRDLVRQLKVWREQGDRLIVCLDANENIYRKSLGKTLTDEDGLGMREVVGDFTGEKVGATYFRGSNPIDGVWATADVEVVGACVMPVGFGVGDHRLFQVDFRATSLVGAMPPKIVRAAARRLITTIPGVVERYGKDLERQFVEQRVNTRLVQASENSSTVEEVKGKVDAIDEECKQYKRHSERKSRKIKSGRIPFSPEASVWIRRRQVYESILRYKQGKIRNRSNLRRSAQRCGIKRPLSLTWQEVKERLKVCEEKCDYFCKHGHAYRRRHLQNRLSVARAKKNKEAEQKILEIIQRERERAFWRRLNYTMSRRSGKSIRRVQVRQEDGTVLEATTQREVEQAIWSEIHGKRFYLAEQAPICKGKLRGAFGYMANTPAAREVLAGTYQCPVETDEGTRDLFEEIAWLRSIIPKNSVSTVWTPEGWRDSWQGKKEKTSSSQSGLHFSHYIAGSRYPVVARHDSLKATICNKWGFALDRWGNGLSCMLEKVAGCCLVDKLRSILLMEADFNANNKELIGNRMMENIRAHGLMKEEIFSELGRTAEDGALSKILFYDIVRQSRLSAAISSVDAANCYDSIAHAVASLIFQACGVPVEGVQAMLSAIQDMKYYLRTAFGDSRNFRGSKIAVKYQGMCQGNGASPAGWAAISITILGAHKKKGHSATFMCPVTNKAIKLAAILYVDDCDLIHVNMAEDESALETFHKMQEAVRNWGRLLIASGGSYKPPKCFFHLISFSWNRDGKWKYDENHTKPEFDMVVPLPDGTEEVIDHLPVTEAKETLGVYSCPNGSSAGAIRSMQKKAQEWVDRAKEGKLRRSDVWFLLDCQFWPRVGYGLCCNPSEHKQLEDCLSKQYFELLPLGGVIRTAPRVVRQLGKGFYGAGCPHPGVECFIGQVGKLLMHYGCPSNLGEKMRISYLQMAIELGMSPQPFQLPYSRYKNLVTDGWLKSIWEKCEKYDVKIVMNDIPLETVRERDKWIMSEFERVGYTGKALESLGRTKNHQQVVYFSEILNASGSSLDERYLRRRPQHEQWSTLKFPKEKPSPADWRLWQQALRRLVPEAGLPVRLGKFLHQGYKLWEWRVDMRAGLLFHYRGSGMSVYTPVNETRRRWRMEEEGCDQVICGVPCSVRSSTQDTVTIRSVASPPDPDDMPESFLDVLREWGSLWMWDSLRLIGDDNWLLEAIRDGTCIAVTDGSYIRELYPDMSSCAFVLECTKGRGRIFGSFAEHSERACAYRGELLGLMAIHLILLAANKLEAALPGLAKIYSDCLGALKKVTSLPETRLPSGCKHSDILKNIMVNCSKLSFGVEYLHVSAHQDDKLSFQQLPRPAQLNCCMDSTAKAKLWGFEGTELPPQEVFPLEAIAVFVGKEKLTSGSEDTLRFWCQKTVAKEVFAHEKVKVLDNEQFEEVEWPAVYQALTDVPRMFQLWAFKQVMGIAGTNEMQARYTPNHSRKCPSCQLCVETCGHVLFCEEEGRVDLLHKSIDLLDQWMREKGTDESLRKYLVKYARARGGRTMVEITGWRAGMYRDLANSMDKIGWRRFMEGMISKEVLAIQRKVEDEGKCKMTIKNWGAGLVTKLLEVTHGQWLYRNVHVHD